MEPLLIIGGLWFLANPLAFAPAGLTPDLARTEGWTFGVT